MNQRKIRLTITILLAVLVGRVAVAGDVVTICGQNVQNFFYSLDKSRTQNNYVPISNYDTAEGRQAKLNAIVDALAPYEADIYAFNEVEAKAQGADKEALDLLVEGLSNKTGKPYKVVNDNLTYDASSDATGTIKSGFVYRSDKIEPVGDNVSTAYGYTLVYPYMMRMQTFKSKASGEQFTLSMNHFKASTSNNMEEDQQKREQNSIALLKGLNAGTDPDILILGDLNSEMGEQCLNNLVDAGYEEQILKRDPSAYSYYFDYGELIDHVFANSTMAKQVSDARILNIANPYSAGGKYYAYSDHDPYLVTLNLEAQPVPVYKYTKATMMQAGVPYLMIAPINGLQAANPVAIDKSYEYQTTTDVTETGGIITMNDAKNAFIFEDDGNGNYLIKDYYGRYVYQFYYTSSSSYSHNTNVDIKANAHPFTVTLQGDGTFKIQNTLSESYYMGLTYRETMEFALNNYASLGTGQYLPWLYQYDPDATPTAITTIETLTYPVTTRKVVENGTILIVTPNGHRYTLQGVEVP